MAEILNRAESAFDDAIKSALAQNGKSLLAHSNESPLLLIFLRHFG